MGATVYDLDTTAANNTTVDGISQAENVMRPPAVNNAFRALDAIVARFVDDLGAVNTVAGTDTITVALSSGITAYATGQTFRFIAANTNTGAATMNVNSIGAKAIRKISGGTDVALSAGDIAQGVTYEVQYRATANSAAGAWVIVGASAPAAATTSAQGIVELATPAEALTGTDATRAVTPAGLYFPTGHLFGLTLSNNGSDATNDIDIAAGTCRDGSDTQNLICTAMTKQLDANWAPGTNAGGRYSGAAIANGTYHWYAVGKALGASQDYYAHPSGSTDAQVLAHLQAETGGASYLYVRRIGSIIRSSGAILAFSQVNDEFLLKATVLDVSAANPGTSAVTRTLTVPTGIKVWAQITFAGRNTGSGVAMDVAVTSLDTNDLAVSETSPSGNKLTQTGALATASGNAQVLAQVASVRTNTSAQVRSRLGASDASCTLYIETQGWIDERGRLS